MNRHSRLAPLAVVAVAACMACWSGRPLAANIDDGKAKAAQICQACHGLDGNSPAPDYPKLGGQRPDYLAKALRDYKSGARKNAIMAGFASTLSPQDIDNVAAYYGAQASVLSVKQ